MVPALRFGAPVARASLAALFLTSPVAYLVPPPAAHGAGGVGADPFADAVVWFDPGVDPTPGYDDPLTALGAPERFTGEGVFPGVVSPFNPPFGLDEIVSLGCGGALVLRFDEPVTDDPDNPFGVDLLVFGNTGFIDDAWPQGVVGGLFGADGGRVEVSADGANWVIIAEAPADGPMPTLGWLDGGPYDELPGTVESDFTRPVDPAVSVNDVLGFGLDALRAVYGGSGGGVGIDLAGTGLAAVSFVRLTNPCDAKTSLEIDAVSDVAPRRAGDADRDGRVDFADILVILAAWGGCPDPPFPCPGDLDGSGSVDFGDVLVVLAHWGP